MTPAEVTEILDSITALREAIYAALPLDCSAPADTALEMGYLLGKSENLKFLLERDARDMALVA